MIFQPFLLESVPTYLSTKERLELRSSMLAGLDRPHSSPSLRHAVARLDFDDSSFHDLVRFYFFNTSFQFQKSS
jgi:hypothetical protein